MINTEFIVKHIKNMNLKSDDFEKIYVCILEKYWDSTPQKEKSDTLFKCARLLTHVINNPDNEKEIITLCYVANELLKFKDGKKSTYAGEVAFADESIYFQVSNQKEGIGNLMKQLTNTVLMKAKND